MYVCILSYLQVVCMYVCISLAAGHRGEGVPLPPPPQRFFKHSVKIENRHWQGKHSSIFKYFFNSLPPPPSPQSETLRAAYYHIFKYYVCMYIIISSSIMHLSIECRTPYTPDKVRHCTVTQVVYVDAPLSHVHIHLMSNWLTSDANFSCKYFKMLVNWRTSHLTHLVRVIGGTWDRHSIDRRISPILIPFMSPSQARRVGGTNANRTQCVSLPIGPDMMAPWTLRAIVQRCVSLPRANFTDQTVPFKGRDTDANSTPRRECMYSTQGMYVCILSYLQVLCMYVYYHIFKYYVCMYIIISSSSMYVCMYIIISSSSMYVCMYVYYHIFK